MWSGGAVEGGVRVLWERIRSSRPGEGPQGAFGRARLVDRRSGMVASDGHAGAGGATMRLEYLSLRCLRKMVVTALQYCTD